jgi:hypothetical protein
MKKILAITLMLIISVACGTTTTTPTQPTQDPDAIFTQVAETIMASLTQTADTETEIIIPTSEPAAALEPAIEVTFICEECVNDDGSIIAISLWPNPDPEMLPPGGYVNHGDKCLLFDEVTNNEGIDKVLLDCPGGKGWVSKEGISYGW